METTESLQKMIRDAPDDESLRLKLADVLEKEGDRDRAEVIRLQCQLDKTDKTDPCFKKLRDRMFLLDQQTRQKWVEPILKLLPDLHPYVNIGFRRGLVESICLPASVFIAHAPALFEIAPI